MNKTGAKTSVYELVTNRIIEQLEKGVVPWQKPWTGVRSGAYNRISKKPYSIINQMLLLHKGEYATFKQWSDLGGHIKKGSKSEMVVFWKLFQVDEKQKDGTTKKKNVPMLRYYNVFHISQVEGVEPLKKDELKDTKPIDEAEKVLNDYWTRENVTIHKEASNRAFYSPLMDSITLPLIEQFQYAEEYYSTAFHESVHSTGHKTRLDRLKLGLDASFGSETYSKEELVAEIGSAMMVNMLGIETDKSFRNSASYIKSWLEVLKNDSRFIVSASSKAEKAVNYILGVE